jgi:hypothetical protein
MSSDESEKQSSLSSLSEALGNYIPRNQEAVLLGDLLYAMHQTESQITLLLGIWSIPLIFRRLDYMLDKLLLKLPIRDKIKFLEDNTILSKEECSKLQSIFDDRNFLAHPRPPKRRLAERFSENKKQTIIKYLSEVNKKLDAHIKEHAEHLNIVYRELSSPTK